MALACQASFAHSCGGNRVNLWAFEIKSRFPKRLHKKAKRGFKGYPVGTIAFYGPDNRFASKVAVAVILGENEDPAALERWHFETEDVRMSAAIGEQVLAFLEQHGVTSVVMTDRSPVAHTRRVSTILGRPAPSKLAVINSRMRLFIEETTYCALDSAHRNM